MHLDVQDLKNFYYRSALGRAAQRAIGEKVGKLWHNTTGQTVVGYGFANPLLRPFLLRSRRVIALMPGPQGAMHWPHAMPNVSVVTQEFGWPLETGHVDRLIVMHGLETSEHPSVMLEEAHRVLGPGGKALFVVPNRAGIWSRNDNTPFGFGRPYTLGQLETQLRQHSFMPERQTSALYQFPSHRRSWQKFGRFFERTGQRIPFLSGGVLIVEASTRFPPIKRVSSQDRKKRIGVLDGLVDPRPVSHSHEPS